jgi:hypothetical protein
VFETDTAKKIVIMVAFALCFMYNDQCWSLTAMMWEVADTPGRFAMASVWEIFTENVYFENRRIKEGK